jgi:RNase P/RNase MRP subunit POP5
MKSLIPSHKEKKRYLFLEGKNLKKNVNLAIKDFIGNLGLAEASPTFVKNNVISINRKSLDKVRASFVLWKEKIEIKRVSGTLKGLEK